MSLGHQGERISREGLAEVLVKTAVERGYELDLQFIEGVYCNGRHGPGLYYHARGKFFDSASYLEFLAGAGDATKPGFTFIRFLTPALGAFEESIQKFWKTVAADQNYQVKEKVPVPA